MLRQFFRKRSIEKNHGVKTTVMICVSYIKVYIYIYTYTDNSPNLKKSAQFGKVQGTDSFNNFGTMTFWMINHPHPKQNNLCHSGNQERLKLCNLAGECQIENVMTKFKFKSANIVFRIADVTPSSCLWRPSVFG